MKSEQNALRAVAAALALMTPTAIFAQEIAVTDHVVHQQELPFLWRGLMDEPCHLATAMIVLGALARWRGRPPSSRFVWAMLSASVMIDLDHLPLELGSGVLTEGTPRPYTHALWVLVLLAVTAAAARHRHQVSGSGRSHAAKVQSGYRLQPKNTFPRRLRRSVR